MKVERMRGEMVATEARPSVSCAEARHLILIADPEVLRCRQDPALRAHLEGCARCAADASHVVSDVGRLRAALIARGSRATAPRRSRRAAASLIPLALAAELALFAFLSHRDSPNALLDRPVLDDTVTTMLPAVHTEIDTGEVIAVVATPSRAVAIVKEDSSVADSLRRAREAEVMAAAKLSVESARRSRVAVETPQRRNASPWVTKSDTL
jgi:hypothetical protein